MKIYYYSGTHWDREWYQTFQGFRKRLVDMVDDMIVELENNPDFGVFHFDGQTIVLEDYLEIRPEMKDRLTALIQKGKIIIGPWYDMPDEFLVSGESLIKNLKRGMAIAREFGVEPSHHAYICDIFGHSSQTPQIFSGMDLHHSLLGRGTNDGDDPAHFLWEALDGTRVCTFKLHDINGYGDFTFLADRITKDGLSDDEMDRALREYVDAEIKRTGIPVILLMDALDHHPLRGDTPRFIAALRRLYPEAEVHHCDIAEFCRAQDEYREQLEVRRGELCRPTRVKAGYNHVITNTLSSRYPLKKYNDINQMRIEKWASPIYALRRTKMAPGFLTLANKYLLQNHPHDSICGCSIDQVHKDMIYRFDQTSQLCDEIIHPFLATMSGDLTAQAIGESEPRSGLCLRVFQPLPYSRRDTVVATVDLKTLPYYREPFGYEKIPAFRLYDANDKEIPYGYVKPLGGERYQIAFEADLTACGITEFYLAPSDMPTRHVERLLTSPRSASGDRVAINIHPDGTLDLTDLATNEVYRNLLTMLDDGEIGDGWFHCGPNVDTLVTPTAADIAVVENNAVRVTFRITQRMRLPRGVERGAMIARSEDTVDYVIRHEVTLAKGDRGITVHTTIDNNADDHRLRLRLPQTVDGGTYEAAQAFGYVTRPCGDDPTTADWKEYGWAERNMAGICAKRHGKRGLAFLSAHGLHECGVWPNGDMDITLMRCFSKTVHTAGEPGGQLRERLEYTYRIRPFTEQDSFADLQKEQDVLSAGIACTTVGGQKAQSYLPLFEISGQNMVYSTAEPNTDGSCDIRLFNDGPTEEWAELTLPAFAAKATLVELDGRPLQMLTVHDGKVRFSLPAFRIATIRLE